MVRYGGFIILLFLVGLSCSCASNSATKQREVSISDNYRKTANGEILIDDRDLDRNQRQITASRESSQGNLQTGGDGSQINAMIDGFGNKVETRIFENHPLLRRIVLRTLADGQKKVFVYAQNGDVSALTGETLDKSMTASADELAKSAGIFTGRDELNLPYFLRKLIPQPLETLVPVYDYSIQQMLPTAPEMTRVEQLPAQESIPAAPVIEQKMLIPEQKPTPERNYQAEINKLLLQPNKRRTEKTEGTLTKNIDEESVKGNDK